MLWLDWMRTLPAEVTSMPEKETIERERKDAAQGKSKSTQAGEFVREEIHHIREGKHGARSPKQAIAIGLSKARRAFFFQAEDGIRDLTVTGVQTCALPI